MNIIVFAVTFTGTVFYLASRTFLSGWSLYYRTWIVVIGDILSFFITPVSFLALFLTGNLKELSKENGIAGKITYVLITLSVVIVLFLYLFIGKLFFWGRSNWEREVRLSADIIEGIKTEDLSENTVSDYYVCRSFFLKKKIPYSEEIARLKAEIVFEKTGKWPEAESLAETAAESLAEQTAKNAEETVEESVHQTEESAAEPTVEILTGDEPTETDNARAETVENAYLCLYEQVFEPGGEPYDCFYNAKGNFYAVLSKGRGKPNDEAPEMDTERTVVYDRISKNDKCHIFVYYETYYDQEGLEYTTAIRNTYAVDRKTGKVTESGKHAWEDTGNKAYREAAGEP